MPLITKIITDFFIKI